MHFTVTTDVDQFSEFLVSSSISDHGVKRINETNKEHKDSSSERDNTTDG
jgi:hypothetical protein